MNNGNYSKTKLIFLDPKRAYNLGPTQLVTIAWQRTFR